MSAQTFTPVGNRLIDGLPRRQRSRLLAQCELVDLCTGDVLGETGNSIRHVHFPLTGIISRLTVVNDHEPLEMGMIGNEGMLGATLALGVDTAPMQGVVQGDGTAMRIESSQFGRLLQQNPALKQVLERYLYVLIEQLAQNASCNSFHEVRPRLARWLLMTHDRVEGDRFKLTHLFLAGMLGVRRSAVTIAAGELQARQFISYSRGQIRVLNRRGLEAASCECYAASVRVYDQRFPPIPRARPNLAY